MICLKCKNEIKEDDLFCNKCGKPLKKGDKGFIISVIMLSFLILIVLGVNLYFNGFHERFFHREDKVETNSNEIEETEEIVNEKIVYSEFEDLAIRGFNSLKKSLKNPESLQIHRIIFINEMNDSGYGQVQVDISAQNGFGGMNRSYYIFSSDPKYQSDYNWDYDENVIVVDFPVFTTSISDGDIDVQKIEEAISY